MRKALKPFQITYAALGPIRHSLANPKPARHENANHQRLREMRREQSKSAAILQQFNEATRRR